MPLYRKIFPNYPKIKLFRLAQKKRQNILSLPEIALVIEDPVVWS